MVREQRIIPLFRVYMSEKVDKPLLETVHSGWLGEGPRTKELESALSKRIGNPRCLTLSAGTHGLHLALHLAGIGHGDSVITTAMTCTASNWPILYQGANIIWADIKSNDLNINPDSIRECINKYTKAIICVHWGGYPCDMEEIKQIADEHDLFIIEDAAHAFGATYRQSTIGDCAYSDFVMMSFQAIKILTTMDGGALFMKSNDDYTRGKLLRWYGIDREEPRTDWRIEQDIPEPGWKYHMNDVCATVGLVNLKEVNKNIAIARNNVAYYHAQLNDFDGVTLLQNAEDRQSSYWLFTILVENRAEFFRMMGEKGISVSRVHERNDKHTCVKQFKRELPILDSIIGKVACIPCGWWVLREDRQYIVETIKGGW